MKNIYFDTVIYNKIFELNLERELTKGFTLQKPFASFRLIGSVLNLQELAMTKDLDKRLKLLALFRRLVGPQILTDHFEIVSRDFESFLRTRKESNDIWLSISGFDGIDRDKELLITVKEQMVARQRSFLAFEREKKNKFKEICQEHKGKVSIELFIEKSLEDGSLLRELCSRVYGLGNEEVLAREIKKCLDSMPRIRRLLKYCFGLIYHHLFLYENDQPAKPHKNDCFDMHHAIYVGCSDVFVTADKDFFKILSGFGESDFKAISWEEFRQKLVDMNQATILIPAI